MYVCVGALSSSSLARGRSEWLFPIRAIAHFAQRLNPWWTLCSLHYSVRGKSECEPPLCQRAIWKVMLSTALSNRHFQNGCPRWSPCRRPRSRSLVLWLNLCHSLSHLGCFEWSWKRSWPLFFFFFAFSTGNLWKSEMTYTMRWKASHSTTRKCVLCTLNLYYSASTGSNVTLMSE